MMKIAKMLILLTVLVGCVAPAHASAWYGDGAGLECSLVPFSSGGGDVWMVIWRGRNERLTVVTQENCEVDSRHVFFNDGGSVSIVVPVKPNNQFFLFGYYVDRGTNVRKFAVAFDPTNGSARFAVKKPEKPEKPEKSFEPAYDSRSDK